ncbi:MAG: asparagine synthase (glutamine-hydrolyzing) [bacterium]|nr:asparagine synthase (glutamine-hydrolyzing) [bacterium]
MCGIAGIIDFAGETIDPGSLTAACASMRHRGPDDQGAWSDRVGPGRAVNVGLAAVRLAVQDLSAAAHQPMARQDGRYRLVFNGEIYNFRELAAELGETFESSGDTEVVLAACIRWGHEALQRFNGMWALAFLDTHSGSGFLARDRFGIKPLLYSATPGDRARCCFASEMRTLDGLVPDPGSIDPQALLHYLRFGYIADPATIYREVRRLPPGCYLPFEPGGTGAVHRYYDLPTAPAGDGPADYSAACSRVRDLVFQAVAARRVADVPVGAFLSGGLDSSIVVAHLASCGTAPVRTFSIGYAEHGGYDETRYARLVARHFATQHQEIKLTYDDVVAALPPMLDHLSEPFADSSILPTALVSRFAREQVTVALSGDGGDELFGGYWRYLGHEAARTYRRLPRWLRRSIIEPLLARAPVSRATSWSNRLRQFRKLLRNFDGDVWDRHLAWSRILAPEAEAILRPAARRLLEERDPVRERMAATAPDAADPLNRVLAFDLQYGLPADMLHKVDLASMFHSLEVRVPLLDVALVEAVAPLPVRFKVDRGLGKRLLIDAHRGLLPDEILTRRKQGFEVPVGEFLRGPLASMFRDTVTPTSLDRLELIDYPAVQRIYSDHCARRGEHTELLFALLVLCHWEGRRHGRAGASAGNLGGP